MLGTSFVIWKDATYPPNPLRPPSVTGIFFFPYIIDYDHEKRMPNNNQGSRSNINKFWNGPVFMG